MRYLATITPVGDNLFLVDQVSRPTDPGFGGGIGAGGDPGYDHPTFPHPGHGLPGYGHPDHDLPWHGHPGNRPPGSWGGHPGNALPIAPVRPSPPIVLPPITTWPPQIPNLPDNSLPPEPGYPSHRPIVIPPDPSIGIDQPIVLPQLPAGTALLIALTGANVALPKDVPAGNKPAILYQGAGTKPVLVYVSAAPAPK